MPSAREALRGEMDYWSDIAPEDRVLYEEPGTPSPRIRALTLGLAAAGAGYIAYKRGALQSLMKPIVKSLGRIDGKHPGPRLVQHLRRAASPLEGNEPVWKQPLQVIDRLLSPMPKVATKEKKRTLAERLLAERSQAMSDLRSWQIRQAGAPDSGLEARVLRAIDDDLLNEQLLFDQAEEARLLKQTGFRHATIQELVDRGVVRMSPDLQQMKQLRSDFFDRIADPEVLIDAAGEVSDLRHASDALHSTIKSLEEDFALPFVRINPFKMLHGSQLLERKHLPKYHFFEPSSIQPVLTGDTDPLQSVVMYVHDRALEFTGDQVNDLGEGWLAPAKEGTVARVMRTLAGIERAQFFEPSPGAPWYKDVGQYVGDALHLGRQDVHPGKASFSDLFSSKEGLLPRPDRFTGSTLDWMFRQVGITPKAKYESLRSTFGQTDYLFMRKAKTYEEAGGLTEYLQQFFASREKMNETTLPGLAPYYFFSRLNEGLNAVNLALPTEDLGSAYDIFKNLMTRRVLPVAGGVYAWRYLNYESENLFQMRPNEVLADMYTGMQADIASVRDTLGITESAKRRVELMPGIDQIQELPVVGPFLRFDRSKEETIDYYTEGVEPVRRGRYWPASNTPFTGDRVDRYVPTRTRLMRESPRFTENWLGEEDEYFAHGWLPTPRYPAAPFRRYVTNPYWAEKRTYHERPYPLTGTHPEFSEFPLIGPILEATIGEFVKPTRRMHPEFWDAYERGESYGEAAPILFGQGVSGTDGSLPGMVQKMNQELVEADPAMLRGGQIPAIITPDPSALPEGKAEEDKIPAFAVLPPGQLPAGFETTGSAIRPVEPADYYGEFVAYVTPSGSIQPMYVSPQLVEEDLDEKLEALSASKIGLQPVEPFVPGPEGMAHIEDRGGRAQMLYNIQTMGGFYGFMLRAGLGDRIPHEPKIARSSAIMSPSRAFWGEEIGRIGGQVSEIGRRFIPRREFFRDYNEIPNQMPSWIPGEDYFQNLQVGDAYTSVRRQGELRLPGAAYEAVWDLPEVEALYRIPEIAALIESGELNRYELYSPITRLRILADVAPWSEDFKKTSAIVSNMRSQMSEEEKEEVKEIREMARTRKQRLRLYPYRFQTAELQHETVTIERVLPNWDIIVEEHPGHPVRMAGVRVPYAEGDEEADAARSYLERHLQPGEQITIGYDADPDRMYARDTYRTIRSVVYAGSTNLNQELLARDLGTEQEQDFSPAAVHARFTPQEIAFGARWESLAHKDTPFHTKLLQVRSPLESYKRRDLYGKDHQRWSRPWSDFVVPTYESFIQKAPLAALGFGLLFGWKTGMGATGFGKLTSGLMIGGALLAGSVYRREQEQLTGEAWIPSRRQEQWEAEEYLDILRYLRKKRQFHQWADMAKEEEGINVYKLIDEEQREGVERRRRVSRLDNLKRRIVTAPQEMSVSEMSELLDRAGLDSRVTDQREAVRRINEEIKQHQQRRALPIGPVSAQALRLHNEMRTTMHGYEGGSLSGVIGSLPKNLRPYFTHFAQAGGEEREEIRRLSPPYLRRILDYLWGEGLQPSRDLETYFAKRALPGPDWAGWDPTVPWEAVRTRVVQSMGLDESDMDIWDDDRAIAERHSIPVPRIDLNFEQSGQDIRQRLRDLLGEAGYDAVSVNVEPGSSGIEVDANLEHDRREEARMMIEQYLPQLLSEGYL